jgi:hypothetical protein
MLEALTGIETHRIHVDKSLPVRRRGAIAATTPHRSSASGSVGQVRRVTGPIRREVRRRAAVVPVIAGVKAEHRMGRN